MGPMIFSLVEPEAGELDAAHMYAAPQTALVPRYRNMMCDCYRLWGLLVTDKQKMWNYG